MNVTYRSKSHSLGNLSSYMKSVLLYNPGISYKNNISEPATMQSDMQVYVPWFIEPYSEQIFLVENINLQCTLYVDVAICIVSCGQPSLVWPSSWCNPWSICDPWWVTCHLLEKTSCCIDKKMYVFPSHWSFHYQLSLLYWMTWLPLVMVRYGGLADVVLYL